MAKRTEELAKENATGKEKAQKESDANREKASLNGPQIAKDIGIVWGLREGKDPMTDEYILESGASFIDESQLQVVIEATCLSKNKQLKITATAFDSSNEGVPFIQRNKEVTLLVRSNNNNLIKKEIELENYNNQLNVESLLISEDCLKEVVQVLTLTGISGMLQGKTPDEIASNVKSSVPCYHQVASKWLELTELRIQFPLAHGNVVARFAPYEPNLRKVLEACAEITPQPQMPEISPSKGEGPLPNSSLFDSLKTQGKLLTP